MSESPSHLVPSLARAKRYRLVDLGHWPRSRQTDIEREKTDGYNCESWMRDTPPTCCEVDHRRLWTNSLLNMVVTWGWRRWRGHAWYTPWAAAVSATCRRDRVEHDGARRIYTDAVKSAYSGTWRPDKAGGPVSAWDQDLAAAGSTDSGRTVTSPSRCRWNQRSSLPDCR